MTPRNGSASNQLAAFDRDSARPGTPIQAAARPSAASPSAEPMRLERSAPKAGFDHSPLSNESASVPAPNQSG
jgi:hypothetical protein